MGAAAVERAQRVERRAVVAGHAEVVAVDVHRVRQAELVDRRRDRLDHLPRRDAGALVVERGDVAVVALEHLDAAGIDELDAVAAGRLQPPGDRLANASGVVADELEERQVVAHQHQEGGVDDGRVAQLGERVARRERRRRGVDDGRVAQQRVAVAGGERRGDGAAGARAGDRGPLQDVGAMLLGRSLRAALTVGPAMWAWMSTPPGITTMPCALIVRACGGTSATIFRPARRRRAPRRRSRWRGRRRGLPAIRSITAVLRSRPARPRRRAVRGQRRVERNRHAVHPVDGAGGLEPSARWRTRRAPPPRRGGVRVDDDGRQLAQSRQRRAVDDQRRVDLAALEQRGGAELAGIGARVAAGEADRVREAGLPGEHVLGAARVALAAEPRA